MKNLRFKRILLLIIVICITCISLACWYNSKSILSVEEYLNRNNSNVDLHKEDYIKGFDIFNDDLKNYDVILAGESHSIAKNYDIQLSMLKYFNKTAGVKYLLLEMAYSSSKDIQQYLETGNENILKSFYDKMKGTAGWSKESYDFWKKLRLLNETLDDNEKIRVIGIDMQYQQDEEINYLYSSLPTKIIPIEIKSVIEKLKDIKENYENKDSIAIKNVIELLKGDIENNTNVYKEYLGDKYFDFTIVLDTLESLLKTTNENYSEIREECMYNNFKKVYTHFPKGKYFGQFGLEHVYQRHCNSYIYEKDRFAMCLNRDNSPVKNRVLSIGYVYKDCSRMSKELNYQQVNSDSHLTDIYILNKYAKTDITIFNLKEHRTPFANELHFVENPTDRYTLDYFQYIILIKNSKGTEPLET